MEGSATAYYLAKEGLKTLLLEQVCCHYRVSFLTLQCLPIHQKLYIPTHNAHSLSNWETTLCPLLLSHSKLFILNHLRYCTVPFTTREWQLTRRKPHHQTYLPRTPLCSNDDYGVNKRKIEDWRMTLVDSLMLCSSLIPPTPPTPPSLPPPYLSCLVICRHISFGTRFSARGGQKSSSEYRISFCKCKSQFHLMITSLLSVHFLVPFPMHAHFRNTEGLLIFKQNSDNMKLVVANAEREGVTLHTLTAADIKLKYGE